MDLEFESNPLQTMSDVMAWTGRGQDYCRALIPMPPNYTKVTHRPRTLVCHDLMGGYLDDRFIQGSKGNDSYLFTQWGCTDLFIYFSHNFITIPPPGWINSAHRNETLMLGTIMTEWDAGAEHCREFLSSKKSCAAFINKLADIAEFYNFDGWLINIEVPVEEEETEVLDYFVRNLTTTMHRKIRHSEVIWYDSVTKSGELKWQDELNSANYIYFANCDGIFLNYTWSNEKLATSAKLSKEADRPYDVFVGVDVFGRGCPGGGGYNTYKALQLARSHDLSVAIFAPSWVYEKHSLKNFHENNKKFWKLLKLYLFEKPLCHLPIVSTFNIGRGPFTFIKGKKVAEKIWTNNQMMSTLPLIEYKPSDHTTKKQYYDFYDHSAYNGSSCLRLSGELNDDGLAIHKIFDTRIKSREALTVSYIWKVKNVEADLNLCLDLKVRSDVKPAHTQGDISETYNQQDQVEYSNNDWIIGRNTVLLKKDEELSSISVKVLGKANLKYTILLGQLSVVPTSCTDKTCAISNLCLHSPELSRDTSKKQVFSCILTWDIPSDCDHFIMLYKEEENGKYIYLGASTCGTFMVRKLAISCAYTKNLFFTVQPFTRNGLIVDRKLQPLISCNVSTLKVTSNEKSKWIKYATAATATTAIGVLLVVLFVKKNVISAALKKNVLYKF